MLFLIIVKLCHFRTAWSLPVGLALVVAVSWMATTGAAPADSEAAVSDATIPAAIIPAAISPGASILDQSLSNRQNAGETADAMDDCVKSGRESGGRVCEVKPYNARPVMFLDGEPRFPMAFMSYYPLPFRYRQMSEHNVHVYSLSLTLTDKWIARSRKRLASGRGLWKGPGQIDFSAVDRAIQEIDENDPDAVIFPRIYCDSPFGGIHLHPDEVRAIREGCPLRQSFSSSLWRKETAEVLEQIVRHVSASRYGNRVIGYMVAAGETEEFGDQNDFTPCALARFREWIWANYKGDTDESVDFLAERSMRSPFPRKPSSKRGIAAIFSIPRSRNG